MKAVNVVLASALVACGIAACRGAAGPAQQASTVVPEPPAVAPQPSPAPRRPLNPHQDENDRYVLRFMEKIAGREDEPAGSVFENIQLEGMKSVEAGRFLRIMNGGYSRALGVECTHCHVEDDFASDDKRPKRAAREMALMHRMINQQLAQMESLESEPEKRFINCSTCHRGTTDPTQ